MNFLSSFFIITNLLLIVLWISNLIGFINNEISRINLYFFTYTLILIPIWLLIWFELAKNQNEKTEISLNNYKQQELNSEDGKACQWLLKNISKLNWSICKYGNFSGISEKYKVVTNHMSFSINNIKYNYIGSISESYILNLIELQIEKQNNKIKQKQKLENIK